MDQTYARKAEEEATKCQLALEDRLSMLQHELEARYKDKLDSELTLHRNRELVKVRLEERERYQQELAKERQTLQHMHQLKLDEMKKSEQRMLEKYRRKEQVQKKAG